MGSWITALYRSKGCERSSLFDTVLRPLREVRDAEILLLRVVGDTNGISRSGVKDLTLQIRGCWFQIPKYKVIRFRGMDKSGERARSSARIERRPSIPGVGESRRSGVRIPAGPPLFRAPDDAAF